MNYFSLRRPIVIEVIERERVCPRCKTTFKTLGTGPKVRCPPCRAIVRDRKVAQANARHAAKRKGMGRAA